MNGKDYAPIIIPTLNRYTHFKRCFESLERCTGANYTDIFIGLDYPPSEKYVEGWKEINNFLIKKENENGFKNLIVRRREHNCGMVGPESNGALLYKDVSAVSDKYIYSEDDNEFSPNFLEYMNLALDKYSNDSRVIKVSGYTSPLFSNITNNSTFFGVDTPAYGLGGWVHKDKDIHILDYKEIDKELHSSWKKMWKLFWTYPALIYMAAHMIKNKEDYGDIRFTMNNLICGTYTLEPAVSLARNWGADGSGLHSGTVKGLEKQAIQTALTFNVQDIPFELPKFLKSRLFYLNMPKDKLKFCLYLIHKFIYSMHFFCFHKCK